MWVAQLSQAWHWKLPKSTLELVVVGRMHGMHVRPGQLLRHRVWQAQTITAQRGHTGQLRQAFSSPFFSSPPLSLSHLSLSLYLSLSLLYSLSLSLNPHKACSHIPLFPLCLSNCCGLKRGMERGEWDWEKETERGRVRGKGGHTTEPLWPGQTVLAPWNSQNSCVQCVWGRASSPLSLINYTEI